VLREKSCGVVPFREDQGTILYLVISSAVTKREHWEFPKGGVEEGERETETALRELMEETGVTDVKLLPGFREPIRYIYRRPEGLVSKQVVYFIGKVGDPKVVLRVEEAKDYRWATYDETYKLIRHANARILLERCHAYILGKPLPERPQRQGQRRPQGQDRGRGQGQDRRSDGGPRRPLPARPAHQSRPGHEAAPSASKEEASVSRALTPGVTTPDEAAPAFAPPQVAVHDSEVAPQPAKQRRRRRRRRGKKRPN